MFLCLFYQNRKFINSEVPRAHCEVSLTLAMLSSRSSGGVAQLLHFCSTHTSETTSVTLQGHGNLACAFTVYMSTDEVGCKSAANPAH